MLGREKEVIFRRKKKVFGLGLVFLFCSFVVNLASGATSNVSAASISSSLVKSYNISGSYSAQSFTYDSDKNKIIVVTWNGNYIDVLDAQSFNREDRHSISGGGHCNGASYNPKFKVVAVAPVKSQVANTYFIYGGNNYSKQGTIKAKASSGGTVAYSRQQDRYFVGGRGDYKILKCSKAVGSCSKVGKFTLSLSGGDQQDAEIYGKYMYQAMGQGTIHKIDTNTKKKVQSYYIGGPELEGITFVGDKIYTLHHSGAGTYQIRKVSDSDAKKMLDGAGSNDFNGSANDSSSSSSGARDVAGTTTPKDISKYKSAVKASAKKKLKKKQPQALKNTTKAPCTSILPEDWCKSESAVFQLINLAAYVITAGVGVLSMAGIIWVGFVYMTAGDNAEKTRLAKKRLLEVVVGLLLWGVFFALIRWFLMGKIV